MSDNKQVLKAVSGSSWVQVVARSKRGLQFSGSYRSIPVALMALSAQAAVFQQGDKDHLVSAVIYFNQWMIVRFDVSNLTEAELGKYPYGVDSAGQDLFYVIGKRVEDL